MYPIHGSQKNSANKKFMYSPVVFDIMINACFPVRYGQIRQIRQRLDVKVDSAGQEHALGSSLIGADSGP